MTARKKAPERPAGSSWRYPTAFLIRPPGGPAARLHGHYWSTCAGRSTDATTGIERAHVLAERRANLERLWREGNVILRQLVQHPADIKYFMPPTLDSLEGAVANTQQA